MTGKSSKRALWSAAVYDAGDRLRLELNENMGSRENAVDVAELLRSALADLDSRIEKPPTWAALN